MRRRLCAGGNARRNLLFRGVLLWDGVSGGEVAGLLAGVDARFGAEWSWGAVSGGEEPGNEVSGGGADVCVGGGERRLLFTGVDARRNVLSGGVLP